LKIKEGQKEEAMYREDTQRLVREEIEMLKVIFCIYCAEIREKEAS
jgi:hypothetical protein